MKTQLWTMNMILYAELLLIKSQKFLCARFLITAKFTSNLNFRHANKKFALKFANHDRNFQISLKF